MKREFPIVMVTVKAERQLRSGHPWVYSEEIKSVEGQLENGGLVDVLSEKFKYLGTGYFNAASKIRIRIISRNTNDKFDRAFYERRIRYALEYRKTVMAEDFSCCRLIFGEADCFPGFTVDRFGNILVTQVLSLGIEKIKDMLYEIMLSELEKMGEHIAGIYERNDVKIRDLEGMEQYKGFWKGAGNDLPGKVEITENGLKYIVDYVNGQKTGFFLDQKYNRAAIRRIAKGRTVLDCFTHTGAFALNAAAAGAKFVNAVDISKDAIELTKNNAELNGLESNMKFTCANVFELLTDLHKSGKSPYDFIILDPPAFTKSKSTVKDAFRGYKEINLKAMRLLPRGGYLATCSCSHFMTESLFKRMLHDAALDAGISLRQIEMRQQSPDHPILWNVPETDYLKFFIFQVV